MDEKYTPSMGTLIYKICLRTEWEAAVELPVPLAREIVELPAVV